jgi:hypothetical protein
VPGEPITSNEAPRSGTDRRISFRYRVFSLEVVIAWEAISSHTSSLPAASGGDEDGRRSVPTTLVKHTAEIVDLSQTGLSVLVAHLPPADRRLWIGIAESDLLSWSEVILRSSSHLAPDLFLLRLSFSETCPYELFKTAVLGQERSGVADESAGPGAVL